MTEPMRDDIDIDLAAFNFFGGGDEEKWALVRAAIEGGATAATSGGEGGIPLTVQDENTNVSTAVTRIDFQGAGVTTTSGTGEVIVTVPGAATPSLTVQDENGTVASGVTQIDFQGAGITAASGAGEVVVTVPSGAPTDASYVTLAANAGLSGERLFLDLSGRGTLAQRTTLTSAWTAAGTGALHAGATWRITDGALGEYPTYWDGNSWSVTSRGQNDFTGPQAVGTSYVELDQITTPTSPAAGRRRVFTDSATGKLSVVTSAGSVVSLEEQSGGGGSGGMLVAPVTFTPGANLSVTTTLADLDATNLAITFTAPANGKVRILVNANMSVAASSTKNQLALREGSTTVGPLQSCLNIVGAARQTAIFVISGISAGSHTYKLAAQMSTGTGTVTTDVVTIEVWPSP